MSARHCGRAGLPKVGSIKHRVLQMLARAEADAIDLCRLCSLTDTVRVSHFRGQVLIPLASIDAIVRLPRRDDGQRALERWCVTRKGRAIATELGTLPALDKRLDDVGFGAEEAAAPPTAPTGAQVPLRIKQAHLAQVLHLLVTADDAETVTLARDELVNRYLADREELIARMAAEFAYEARG